LSLPLATLIAALVAVFSNRIFAVLVGLWFRVPGSLLLGILIGIDIVQIPLYYILYERGSSLIERLPSPLCGWLKRDWSVSGLGRWASHLGGLGVMTVAALPTFGGGIWSAVFIAYHLGLNRAASYVWLILGSLLSYFSLYWVLDTLVMTVRYFMQ